MRNKKTAACILSVLLAASVCMNVSAGTVDYSDGQQHTVNSNVVEQDPAEVAVSSRGEGTSVTVNGDVKSEGAGFWAYEEGKVEINGDIESERGAAGTWDAGSSAVVNGSVTTKDDGNTAGAHDGSELKVTGDVISESTTKSAAVATNGSTLEIGGNVANTNAVTTGDHVPNTLLIQDGSSVKVDGNVSSTAYGASVSRDSKAEVGGSMDSELRNVRASENSTVVVVGDVKSKSEAGVFAREESSVTVGGDVEGKTNGITAEGSSKITVEGSVKSADGSAVKMTNDSEITVKKDASGAEGIVIRETNSQKNGSAVVLGTVTATAQDGYCITVTGEALSKEDVIKALPDIIVGELSSSNQKYVAYEDNSGQSSLDTKEVAKAIAEQILFHIDVQDPKNGNINLAGGTSSKQGYDVAKAGDTVSVTVTADHGYEIKSVDGGKATAVKNADGSWSVTVPQTGGVSFSAIMEAIRQVENKTGDGDGSDEGSNVSTTPNTPNDSTYTDEKAADGSQVHVFGKTTGADHTKSGVVLSDRDIAAGIIDVYTGDAKTAGLPDAVKNVIAAVDGGNLGNVPGLDLTGKKVSGATMALGIRPDGTQNVAASLYVPNLPAGAVPFILFFDNKSGEWKLIPASINPTTGLVEFVLPDDGTAAVIY